MCLLLNRHPIQEHAVLDMRPRVFQRQCDLLQNVNTFSVRSCTSFIALITRDIFMLAPRCLQTERRSSLRLCPPAQRLHDIYLPFRVRESDPDAQLQRHVPVGYALQVCGPFARDARLKRRRFEQHHDLLTQRPALSSCHSEIPHTTCRAEHLNADDAIDRNWPTRRCVFDSDSEKAVRSLPRTQCTSSVFVLLLGIVLMKDKGTLCSTRRQSIAREVFSGHVVG